MIRFLFLVAIALPATAEDKVSCPLILPKTTVDVQAPAGWTGYSSSIVRLTGFGMMAGPPESMTYLVPMSVVRRKDGGVQSWVHGVGEEKWVYCTYDGSGAIQISKRMADSATECKIEYKQATRKSITEMTSICR